MAELPDTMKLSPWTQFSETPLSSANLEQNCDMQTASNQQFKPSKC